MPKAINREVVLLLRFELSMRLESRVYPFMSQKKPNVLSSPAFDPPKLFSCEGFFELVCSGKGISDHPR
jgi:hypothetical protein